MNRQRNDVRALAVSGLVLIVGAGCHESSSEGAQPAASASSAAAPAPSASAAEQTAANAPDQAGDEYDDQDPSAVTDFHQTLDPAGKWVEDPKMGTVWVPSPSVVGATFVPYQTGGHWAYGDDYTWVSDYDWGWAPFHYGRWSFIEGTGWGWIPGRVYAPAWVSWRVGAPGFGFVGWSPMAPAWGWRAGVAFNFGFQVAPRWSYCATGDLFSRSVGARVVTGPRATQAENGTKPWGDEGGGSERSGSGSGSSKSGGHKSGPPPSKLGLNPDQVPHLPPNDAANQHAQAFSKPSTATAQGGHPPTKTTAPNLKENPAALPGKNAKSPSDNSATNDKPPSNLHAPTPGEPKEPSKEPSKDSTHGGKPSSGKKEK